MLPIEELTPIQIVQELDRYIVGQAAAKKAVAVALRNRYRRQQLPEHLREDIVPKNILMMGPTGVGKTEIARRLAQMARAPFIKVEATKFTEVGYVGRDVESMIRDLVGIAVRLVQKEKSDEIRAEVDAAVDTRLTELLEIAVPRPSIKDFEDWDEEVRANADYRGHLLERLKLGEFESQRIDVDREEPNNPFMQVFSNQGIEEMGIDTNMSAFPARRFSQMMTVRDARGTLFEQEAKRLMDRIDVNREAINRTEQTGIIFLDEIDKVAGKQGGSGPDVSREGVQRDLLPVIEGSTVATKFGPVRTDHILFIAAGAFHMSKPSDLIPELQGRLPIRVELDSLRESDLRRILSEPKNALTRQYEQLLATDNVTITFTDDALDAIAKVATELNAKTENIGARRLHTVMEQVLSELLFEAPYEEPQTVTITAETVRKNLKAILEDPKQSGIIL